MPSRPIARFGFSLSRGRGWTAAGGFVSRRGPGEGSTRVHSQRGEGTVFIVNMARRASQPVPVMVIAFFLILEGSALGVQPQTTLEKMGSQVYCQCGCVTTLNHCPHLPSQCGSRAELTAEILKDIKQGKDEPAILQDLAHRYGVKVLASPPAKGFDLTVWVLPGFALVIGLFAVMLIVQHLRRKPSPEPPKDEPLIDPKIMAAVEEELDRTVPSVVNDK
jgi:cytochrome c-type biogenesis protein CcmH/NrfF